MKEILKLKQLDYREPYIPTEEEKEAIKMKPGHFKLSGDYIFTSVQGEGPRLGKVTTFIRLHFCSLRCGYCDTYYAVDPRSEKFYKEPVDLAVKDLEKEIFKSQRQVGIEEEIKRVVFTGGEPLIQQTRIEEWLKDHEDWEVEIETNATIMPLKTLVDNPRVYFNCSPKTELSGNPMSKIYKPEVINVLASKPTTCFKFVCKDKQDIDNALRKYANLIPKEQIWIMPEGITKEENTCVYKEIAGYIVKLGLNTTPRLQNIMFNGSKRKV